MDLASVIGQPEVLLMFEAESNWGNNVYIDDAQVGTTVGIGEQSGVTFAIYPNPATDQVRLDLGALNGSADVSIIDATGRTVMQRGEVSASQWMDLSSLADGTYTVLVRANGGVGSHPVVVLHTR